MSTWQEPKIDLRPGRVPQVTTTETTVTFELPILTGKVRDGLFVATSRTRLSIRCHRDGEITLRILEGPSAC